jgi:hypothetical protein
MQVDETNMWIPWVFGDHGEDRISRFSSSALR